ncbi:MAG: HAMP domain-containing protein, partial [Halobacteriovoraceae bacterium]|nr:HAMP domain-containing protein [Halobacteriovoraceae bacterium]
MTENTNSQIRVVRFPIKFKLIAIITFLLLASLSIYAIYALDHFKKDKSAYIFETALSNTEGISNLLIQDLKNTQQSLRLMGNTYNGNSDNAAIVKNIFEANPNIIEFSIYSQLNAELQFALTDQLLFTSNGLKKNHFSELLKKHPIPFGSINESITYIENPSADSKVPHLLLAEYSSRLKQYFVARLKLDGLMDLLQSNSTYKTFVLKTDGQPLIHKDIDQLILAPTTAQQQFHKQLVLESDLKKVKEYVKQDGSEVLVSYNRNKIFGLLVVSEISKEKALSVATFLIKKSVYFAIFLVSLSIIIGILFSRNITAPVDKLFRGIQGISKGDFRTQVSIGSVDEIGALSDSFNFMSTEILRYMDEMKEKLRLEKEV